MMLFCVLIALPGHSGLVDALLPDTASEVVMSQGDVTKSKDETAIGLPRSWQSPSWDTASRYAATLVTAEGSSPATAPTMSYLLSLANKRGVLAAAGASAVTLAVLLGLWLRRADYVQRAMRPSGGPLEGRPAGDDTWQPPASVAEEAARPRLRLEDMHALERVATGLVAYIQNEVTTAGLARLRAAVDNAKNENEKVLALMATEPKGEGEASAAKEAMMRLEKYADAVVYEAWSRCWLSRTSCYGKLQKQQ